MYKIIKAVFLNWDGLDFISFLYKVSYKEHFKSKIYLEKYYLQFQLQNGNILKQPVNIYKK